MNYADNSYSERTDVIESSGSSYYGIPSKDDAYLSFEAPYIRKSSVADRLNEFLSAHYKIPILYVN